MKTPTPLEIELLASDDERRPATQREECLTILLRLQGRDGIEHFLRARQPALDDLTGAQLLQNRPQELLRRLRTLEADMETESLLDEIRRLKEDA